MRCGKFAEAAKCRADRSDGTQGGSTMIVTSGDVFFGTITAGAAMAFSGPGWPPGTACSSGSRV
jgi:hypothetical protein